MRSSNPTVPGGCDIFRTCSPTTATKELAALEVQDARLGCCLRHTSKTYHRTGHCTANALVHLPLPVSSPRTRCSPLRSALRLCREPRPES